MLGQPGSNEIGSEDQSVQSLEGCVEDIKGYLGLEGLGVLGFCPV